MPILEVSLPATGIPEALSYELPESLWADDLVGRRVKVTLQRRPVVGVIVGCHSGLDPESKLKPIEALLDQTPVVTTQQLELCRFVAEYYFAPLGEVLRLCLPPDTPRTFEKNALPKRRKRSLVEVQTPVTSILLNPEQQAVLEQIIQPNAQKASLLEGITGSGKTEVYIHAAKHALAQGQSVLVVVPEIALTPQLEERFRSQLQEPLVSLHSGLSQVKRREALHALLEGKVRLALGARSALFAPMHNLGLIVVDEEHDPSFKQEDTPRYHARDVALWRAHHENARIILGSATPSLETRLNAERGKLQHLKLLNRASSKSVLPRIELIDLKSRHLHSETKKHDRSQSEGQSMAILSGPLRQAMTKALARGEQVLLFLNRRGYASIAVCDACGNLVQCPNCSVSLIWHQSSSNLRCHQCDYFVTQITHCPHCQEGPILCLGVGTERVQTEVELFFPDFTVSRLDRDSANTPAKMHQILEDVRSQKAQILIGTQMTAKGHDFPNLSLVGVILADIGLSVPDFRASERTFQLLTQVSGRAGRREIPGRVLIQTFNPNHPALTFVQSHDIEGFSALDRQQRLEMKQPPFVRAAIIRVETPDRLSAQANSGEVLAFLKSEIEKLGVHKQVSLLGPAPALIEKLRNQWRWQLYLRAPDIKLRAEILKNLPKLKLKKTRLIIDVDPVSMF